MPFRRMIDGLNDGFQAVFDPQYPVLEFEIQIYDRWGGLVFSSLDATEAWDGTRSGRPLGSGVYVYLLQFTFEDQGAVFEQQVAGDVALIR